LLTIFPKKRSIRTQAKNRLTIRNAFDAAFLFGEVKPLISNIPKQLVGFSSYS